MGVSTGESARTIARRGYGSGPQLGGGRAVYSSRKNGEAGAGAGLWAGTVAGSRVGPHAWSRSGGHPLRMREATVAGP